MSQNRRYTLSDLAQQLGLEWVGDGSVLLSGLATLQSASSLELSFFANPRYRQQLQNTRAGAVLVKPNFVAESPVACLISDNPYLMFAKASQLFDNRPPSKPGLHPSAYVSSTATVAASASIGANCCIEDGVSIAADVVIGAACVIGENSVIGKGSRLCANVTVYHGICIGEQVVIHSAAVIGADGFGFAPNGSEGWVKIAQLGGVSIGNRVEIGAGTTIDRGALDDTLIGDGVIIDNQVQIAHNVVIGENTAIAGCTAVAGSTTIGANCTIAGAVGIIGHLQIADKVHVTAMSLVTKSIHQAGSYSSGTAMMETGDWRKSAVRFSQLDSLSKRLRQLEKEQNK